MPNENEHPRYTDPDHPYSGSGLRYQNNYNRNEYHAGDGPFPVAYTHLTLPTTGDV